MKIKLQEIIDWLTLLVIFLLPIQTIWILREINLNGFKWQQGTVGFYVTEGIFWLLIIFQVVKWLKERRRLKKLEFSPRTTFLLSIVLISIYVGLTVLWSGDGMLAQVMWVKLLEGILLMMLLINNRNNWHRVAWAVMLAGIFQGGLAVSQFLSQHIYANKWLGIADHFSMVGGTYVIETGGGRWLRAYGTFTHPNILGGFLAVAFIFALVNYFHTRSGWLRICSMASVLVISAGVFVSFSRSAFLAYLVVLVWLSFVNFKDITSRKKLYRLWVYVLLLLTILTVIYFPLVSTRILGNGRLEEKSVTERIDLVNDAKMVISSNLVLGTGIGNYTYEIYQNDPLRPGWAYQPVHNVPLLVWGELGLVGLILSLVMIASLFVLVIRQKRIMSVGFALLLVLAILSVFDHYLWSQYFGLMFSGLIIGMALSE